jgi:hypothetical protein
MAVGPIWCAGELLAQPFNVLGQTFCEARYLFETAPLEHGALLSVRGRSGAQLAFSSQMKAKDRAVTNY